jgi:hypothetical protein
LLTGYEGVDILHVGDSYRSGFSNMRSSDIMAQAINQTRRGRASIMTLYAPQRHDIVVQNTDGQFVAVIEIKNLKDLSRDTATNLRRNSMKYSLLPQTPYFLLLTQDQGFLWKESWIKGPETPPTYEFPMDKVVARYLKRTPSERLYEIELEFLALQWLNDLAGGKQKTNEEPEATLALAGFNEAIKEATVSIEVEE